MIGLLACKVGASAFKRAVMPSPVVGLAVIPTATTIMAATSETATILRCVTRSAVAMEELFIDMPLTSRLLVGSPGRKVQRRPGIYVAIVRSDADVASAPSLAST